MEREGLALDGASRASGRPTTLLGPSDADQQIGHPAGLVTGPPARAASRCASVRRRLVDAVTALRAQLPQRTAATRSYRTRGDSDRITQSSHSDEQPARRGTLTDHGRPQLPARHPRRRGRPPGPGARRAHLLRRGLPRARRGRRSRGARRSLHTAPRSEPRTLTAGSRTSMQRLCTGICERTTRRSRSCSRRADHRPRGSRRTPRPCSWPSPSSRPNCSTRSRMRARSAGPRTGLTCHPPGSGARSAADVAALKPCGWAAAAAR